MRFRACAAVFCLLVSPLAALGASRGLYGGNLQISVVGKGVEMDPLLADTLADATLARMTARGICQLDRQLRIQPVLASEISRPDPVHVRVSLRPGLQFPSGRPIGAAEVLAAWARLSQSATSSPYRAWLFPLHGEGRDLSPMPAAPLTLDLRLSFAWPDLEKSLCHPVLSIAPLAPQGLSPGLGPFTPGSVAGIFEANPSFPWGRPYLNKIAVAPADERKALRLFSLKQAQVLIGGEEAAAGTRSGPALYATYLVFVPDKVGSEFRVVFDSAVDRADLTRFFVRSASVPMYKLLPPALMPQEPLPRTGAPKSVPRRELTLLYDLAQPEQRAVAERIQVKLHSRGYRVSLKGVPRSELRSRWSSGQFDLMLQGVLLPPIPSLALPVVIELAGRHSLLDTELRLVGAEADEEARFRKARERLEALAPELPLIPLYAQSARIAVLPQVTNLDFDAQGLPDFDGAFIGAE